MAHKIDLGDGESISWEEIKGRPEFSSLPPERQAQIRDRFFTAYGKTAHPEAFKEHPQTEADATASKKEGGFLGAIGNKVPIIDKMLPGAQRVAEGITEADKPLVERAFPEQTAAFRDLGDKAFNLAGHVASKGARLVYDDPSVGRVGDAVRTVGKFATELPIQMTSPSGIASMGAGAVEKSMLKTAAETGWKGLAARTALGGEAGMAGVERAMIKGEAESLLKTPGTHLPKGVRTPEEKEAIQNKWGVNRASLEERAAARSEANPPKMTSEEIAEAEKKIAEEQSLADIEAQRPMGEAIAEAQSRGEMSGEFRKRLQPGEVGYGEQLAKDELERRNSLAMGTGQRGALPPGKPEPGAQPTKPLLEQPKKPVPSVEEEEFVSPASETPMSPGSDIPVGSQMAEAKPSAIPKKVFTRTNTVPSDVAKEAAEGEIAIQSRLAKEQAALASRPKMVEPGPREMRAAEAEIKELPYQQTAKGAAAESKLRSDISKLAKGEIPAGEEAPRQVSKLQRGLQKAKQYFIDPRANVKVFSEDLHNLATQGMDAAVGKLSQAAKPAVNAITNNLKDPTERVLFARLYNIRSMGEAFEKSGGKLDYGGLGSKAKQMSELMRLELLKNGKSSSWARINKAVEEFADSTSKAGLEHLKGFVDEKILAEWGEKYRYYMSFKNFDEDAVKFIHGEEGVVKHAIPSMEEYSLGATKGRVGGEAILTDPLEAFQKSLWQKIVASHKKQVIDKAVEYSTSKLGQSLQKEFELTGGKGWGTYKTAKGDVVPMPDVIVDFLTKSDKHTATIYSELANALNPIARRGYLDLNVRYYPGMVMRDVADVFLRAPGYLTPQTEAIAKKLSKATGIKEDAPDLEYILNPAPWLRGLKASMRVNFGKWGGETDKIFEQLERQGALQTGSVQHVMRTEKLKALYPASKGDYVSKTAGMVYESMGNIMKAWDDTIRIGNYLRNTPKEMRGLDNMKKVMSMETLPGGPVSVEKMNAIVRNNHIDFKMMGDGMRDLKLLNPFLNPAIQDKYQTLQYAKKQPISFALTTSAFIAAATGSYLKWKSKPEGRLLNPKDTQRFIMVDTGIRSKSGGVYAMPVTMIPDSIQPIWLAVRNAIDVMDEKSPEFRAILKKNYAKKTAANVGSAMANISGPFVAGVETMMNYSLYLDKPVEGKYNESLSPELRAQKNVPNVFRMMGKAGISPDKAAYLTRGTLGTPGMAVAGWMDRPLAKFGGLKMPKEGSETPVKPVESAVRGIKGLPKAVGLVREQKYDKQYEEMREFLEPSMAKDADAREVIRKYGQRFGQEKDPELKKRYLARALELYKGYVNSLDKDERARVVDFNTLFRKAIEDAAKAQATGMNRTVSGWRKRFPGATGEILGRKLETEEEQAP